MQYSLADALTNLAQFIDNHHDLFLGSCITIVIGILIAILHEGLKKQCKREQPFDESNIYK